MEKFITGLWAYKYFKSDENTTLSGLIQANSFDDAYERIKSELKTLYEDRVIFCILIHLKNVKKTKNQIIDT
jgi:hypothetical protein